MSAFVRTARVRFAHCDAAGLIFYPRFFELINEAVEDWFAGPLAHPFSALHIGAHMGVPSVHFEVEFRAAMRLGDELNQRLTVAALGETSCRLRHIAHVGDVLVATVAQVIVYVELQTMRAAPWPPELRARMAEFMEESQ